MIIHLKHLKVQVHVIPAKQDMICELVRVVLVCNLQVQVRIPGHRYAKPSYYLQIWRCQTEKHNKTAF